MPGPIYKSADVKKTSDKSVEIKRSFNADREAVYATFTQPALIKRWMLGPPGWNMPVCEMDVKEGGKFHWRWRSEENKSEFGFHGTYRQVIALKKVVHTQTFDPGTLGGDMGGECLITVTFEGGDFTTVTTTINYKSAGDLEKALSTGMTDGMEMSYKLLDGVLKES